MEEDSQHNTINRVTQNLDVCVCERENITIKPSTKKWRFKQNSHIYLTTPARNIHDYIQISFTNILLMIFEFEIIHDHYLWDSICFIIDKSNAIYSAYAKLIWHNKIYKGIIHKNLTSAIIIVSFYIYNNTHV